MLSLGFPKNQVIVSVEVVYRMPFSPQQRKEIIRSFPFPLAYTYQELVGQWGKIRKMDPSLRERTDSEEFLWMLMRSFRVFLRTIGTLSVSDYLASRKNLSDPQINRVLLKNLISSTNQSWHNSIVILLQHFWDQRQNKHQSINRLLELLDLHTRSITLEKNPPPILEEKLQTKKPYSWCELMEVFIDLEKELTSGQYRNFLPEQEVLDYYFFLLEKGLEECFFLSKYNIYVLVSKDERKTRGFLCRGTRGLPVGIKGISEEKWSFYQRKPFLAYQKNKLYLSLFPFMIPHLQRVRERTSFSDLLLVEQIGFEKLKYYGYRQDRLLDYEDCTNSAHSSLQQELRWLKLNSEKLPLSPYAVEDWSSKVSFCTRYFVGRKRKYQELEKLIESHSFGSIVLYAPSGYGKTSFLGYLYLETEKELWPYSTEKIKDSLTFAWYFCSSTEERDDPLLILKSLYAQIWKKVLGEPEPWSEKLQKLPSNLENMQKSFLELLERASRESLRGQKLLIILDDIDIVFESFPQHKNFLSFVLRSLPENIFFIFSRDLEREAGDKEQQRYLLSQVSAFGNFFSLFLEKFSEEEIASFLQMSNFEKDPVKADALVEELSQKSEGNPLYLTLLVEAFDAKAISLSKQNLPSGLDELTHHLWENLSDQENFLAYRILTLLAAMKEQGDDAMLAQIFGENEEKITQVRHRINFLLAPEEYKYTLFHKSFRGFLERNFRDEDRKQDHSYLAHYYDCVLEGERDYKSISRAGLLFLTYHYRKSGNFETLVNLGKDQAFKSEKLKRFKSYQYCLHDVQQALEESFIRRDYEKCFLLGYHYCFLMRESHRGMERIFRYAEYRDYTLALERARLLPNESDFFQALLLILWHAIDNKDEEEVVVILKELDSVPSESIGYQNVDFRPAIIFLLKKLSCTGIKEITPLIRKHSFHGKETLTNLLELDSLVALIPSQRRVFLDYVITILDRTISSQEKIAILPGIFEVLEKAGSFRKNLYLWDELKKRILSFQPHEQKLVALCQLARVLAKYKQEEYLMPVTEEIALEIGTLEKNKTKVLAYSRLSHLASILHGNSKARFYLEKSFIALRSIETISDQVELLREMIPDIESLGNYQETKVYWKRIVSVAQKEPVTDAQTELMADLAQALSRYGEWERSFRLMKYTLGAKMEVRASMLLIVSAALKEATGEEIIAYWENILEQTRYLSESRSRLDILKNTAKGLLQLEISLTENIWKRFWLVCNSIKDLGEEAKDNLLSQLAIQFCEKELLDRAAEIISRLSSPYSRALPLAELAIKQVHKQNFTQALLTVKEINDLKERYRVFRHFSEEIPPGDSGRALWKKLTNSMAQIEIEGGSIEVDDLFFFMHKLSLSLPLDESEPIWQEFFSSVENVLPEEQKVVVIEEALQILQDCRLYRKTIHFWPFILSIVSTLSSSLCQAQVYTEISMTLVHLGEEEEAQKFLGRARQCLEKDKESPSAIPIWAKIAKNYREMGYEKKYRKISQDIIRQINTLEKSMSDSFSPLVMNLAELGLEDLAKLLSEKALLGHVDVGTDVPSASVIGKAAEFCWKSGRSDWTIPLFYQILSSLSSEPPSNLNDEPSYTYVIRLLHLMSEEADEEHFPVIHWEQAQAMALNFSNTSSQQRYLETLAEALALYSHISASHPLWEKLFSDSHYVGVLLDQTKTAALIAKHYVKVFSKHEIKEELDKVWRGLQQLNSEYDKLELYKLVGAIFQSSQTFQLEEDEWKKFCHAPDDWGNQDCQANAYQEIIKTLASQAVKRKESKLVQKGQVLLEKITKSATFLQSAIFLIDAYQELEDIPGKKNVLRRCHQFIQNTSGFPKNQFLIQITEAFLKEEEYSSVDECIGKVESEAFAITLRLQVVYSYYQSGQVAHAQDLLKICFQQISHLAPQEGERVKMYALVAQCFKETQGIEKAKEVLQRMLDSWPLILGSSYQQETIAYVAPLLESIGSYPRVKNFWQNLIHCSQEIEQETYRAWALQKIAEAYIRQEIFSEMFTILSLLPPIREVKLQILECYGREIAQKNPEKAIEILSLVSAEERPAFVRCLSGSFYESKNRGYLFRLLLAVPGDFPLTNLITLRILELTFHQQGSKIFQKWFKQIASHWSVEISQR